MHLSRQALLALPLCASGVFADFLGPTYPAPLDITSDDSLVAKGWKNLSDTLDAYLVEKSKQAPGAEPLTGVENITFSMGLFSLNDPEATKLQYHYTSHEVAKSKNKNGTKKVDADTIYRVASVSKLVTVFAGLLELTEEQWNTPVTQIIPQLEKYAQQNADEEVDKIQWDQITPWALASQLAGVTTIGPPAGDLEYLYAIASLLHQDTAVDPVKTYGFPPLDPAALGPCTVSTTGYCDTPDDFWASVNAQPSNFLPWTTPAYADDGYMLLGLVIANITGKPMEEVYLDSVFKPLNMTSSNSTAPTGEAELARSAIVGNQATGFSVLGGYSTPSGGIFSTVVDMQAFGLALLNSTLLPANTTRKWMKPVTHTASLTYSIGAPWEIIRYVNPATGKVTDLYTKLGDSGNYGAIVCLIPDYEVGFTLLNAATDLARGNYANVVIDYVDNIIIPALDAQAALEATANLAGTYSSTDAKLNSSVTIAFNQTTVKGSLSGLSITEWISNGTDLLASDLWNGVKPKLLPSIPKQKPGPGKIAFQASVRAQTTDYLEAESAGIGPQSGFYLTNFDWLTADATHYGNKGVHLFIFDVDGKGKASKITPAATRATLEKKVKK